MSDAFQIDSMKVNVEGVKLLKMGWERVCWKGGRERCRIKSSKISVTQFLEAL